MRNEKRAITSGCPGGPGSSLFFSVSRAFFSVLPSRPPAVHLTRLPRLRHSYRGFAGVFVSLTRGWTLRSRTRFRAVSVRAEACKAGAPDAFCAFHWALVLIQHHTSASVFHLLSACPSSLSSLAAPFPLSLAMCCASRPSFLSLSSLSLISEHVAAGLFP